MEQLTTPPGPLDPRIAAILACALVQRVPAPERVVEDLERLASSLADPDYRIAAAFVRDHVVIRAAVDRAFHVAPRTPAAA